MQDFIVIEYRDPVKYMEEVEEKLGQGYLIISSGQYIAYSSEKMATGMHLRPMATIFWAHLAKN